jgi:alkylation response protein AidB-like acyl-CoA dehydrogenase
LTGSKMEGQEEKTDQVTKPFGELIPYSDPYWYNGQLRSPYYNNSHVEFRAVVRKFIDTHVLPYVDQWDEEGTYPPELHKMAYECGIYGAIWPKVRASVCVELGWVECELNHRYTYIYIRLQLLCRSTVAPRRATSTRSTT